MHRDNGGVKAHPRSPACSSNSVFLCNQGDLFSVAHLQEEAPLKNYTEAPATWASGRPTPGLDGRPQAASPSPPQACPAPTETEAPSRCPGPPRMPSSFSPFQPLLWPASGFLCLSAPPLLLLLPLISFCRPLLPPTLSRGGRSIHLLPRWAPSPDNHRQAGRPSPWLGRALCRGPPSFQFPFLSPPSGGPPGLQAC